MSQIKVNQKKIDNLWEKISNSDVDDSLSEKEARFEKHLKKAQAKRVVSKLAREIVEKIVEESNNPNTLLFVDPISNNEDGGVIGFITAPKVVIENEGLNEKILKLLNSDKSIDLADVVKMAGGNKDVAMEAYYAAVEQYEG